jgi:hypothetical protein
VELRFPDFEHLKLCLQFELLKDLGTIDLKSEQLLWVGQFVGPVVGKFDYFGNERQALVNFDKCKLA